ncbi:MAG: extracellular solute-binding protein [Trueperaceae bacterium]|nr:extracellular solute-binding protein [Trueperaceae bacterium]
MKDKNLNRREFLKTLAGASAVVVAGGNILVYAQEQDLPQGAEGKLTVIHRTEYFSEVQDLFRADVEEFAASKGIQLDISTANPEMFGDFMAKMLAAVQAGNAPDLAYHSLSVPQLYGLGLVEDVTNVVEQAVSMYGEVVPQTAERNAVQDGKWWAVPFISNATGWFARKDVFDAKGISMDDLTTWDGRREAALEVSDPDNQMWGWGVTVNQSGDGHGFIMNIIHSFGGSITDETGLKVNFDSPETLAAVEWLTETYTSDKYKPMLPPGIESWTDVSNNEAYLAGTVAVTQNAFSVYAKAKADGNPVFENTAVLHAGVGPVGYALESGANSWMTIFKGTKNRAAAEELILHMLTPEVFTPMVQLGGGLFLPAYKNLWTEDLVNTDPNFKVIEEILFNPIIYNGTSHPALPNAAADAVLAASIPSQMMANITTGRMTPEEAVKDAHKKIVDIFEEGGIMQ